MKFYYIVKNGKVDDAHRYFTLRLYPRETTVKALVTTRNKHVGGTNLYSYKEIEID